MAIEYKVLKEKNEAGFFGNDGRDDFCKKVAKHLNNGWQLSGGISVIKDDGDTIFYQAVYRDEGK